MQIREFVINEVRWIALNNLVQLIWPQFGTKLDLEMGHRDGMSPERCDAVRGAAAPFPAAPSSKWRPFNNCHFFGRFASNSGRR